MKLQEVAREGGYALSHTAFSTRDKSELRVGEGIEKLWRKDEIVDSGVDTDYVSGTVSRVTTTQPHVRGTRN